MLSTEARVARVKARAREIERRRCRRIACLLLILGSGAALVLIRRWRS